jgi:hypothetical protein
MAGNTQSGFSNESPKTGLGDTNGDLLEEDFWAASMNSFWA